MEVRFDLASDEWTSGEFLADYGGPVDMSGYTSIEFPVMLRNDYGANTSWGGPGLNRMSTSRPGKSEKEKTTMMTELSTGRMPAPWWNGTLICRPPGTIREHGRTVSITLSPDEKARLNSLRSFRIIIDAQSVSSGRLIMGAPEFTGSSFRAEVRENIAGNPLAVNQSVAADEVSNSQSASLLGIYPETARLFHPEGETNESLRVRWGADAGGSSLVPR